MTQTKGEVKRKITLEVSETVYDLLSVLGDPTEVVGELIDHAQQGVYRPGAWERAWVFQAFGDEWTDKLEQGDPYDRPMQAGGWSPFQRPKSK